MATAGLDAGGLVAGGVALSAGWMPKAVPAVEPNEDGALLAVGPAGVLLAVADGHGGAAASVGALRALARAVPETLSAPGSGADTTRMLAGVARGAVTVAAAGSPARTALTLVLVTPREVFWVGYGDSAAFVVAAGGRMRPIGAASPFLGPGAVEHPVGRRRRHPGDAVVLVSDGVPDYLGRMFPAVVGAAARCADGQAAASELVRRAGTAGAGDNITAAVLVDRSGLSWPTRLRRP